MVTTEMVEKVAKEKNISKKVAREEINYMVNLIFEGLYNDGIVKLGEYGSLKIKKRKERVARNPRNPEEQINVPARYAIAFSESSKTEDTLIDLKAAGKFES
jgi:nucleoid DNA-binding protein